MQSRSVKLVPHGTCPNIHQNWSPGPNMIAGPSSISTLHYNTNNIDAREWLGAAEMDWLAVLVYCCQNILCFSLHAMKCLISTSHSNSGHFGAQNGNLYMGCKFRGHFVRRQDSCGGPECMAQQSGEVSRVLVLCQWDVPSILTLPQFVFGPLDCSGCSSLTQGCS